MFYKLVLLTCFLGFKFFSLMGHLLESLVRLAVEVECWNILITSL